MVYVKNNRDFACSFKVNFDGREKKFDFDCQRIYTDTGNIATTGVTPIADEDYKFLYENCKQFKNLVDAGLFTKTKKDGATSAANKMDALEKENAILKAKLEEKTKEAATVTNEETEKLAKENASLKAKLEAMAKKGKNKNKDDEETTEEEF